jgi:hypothetical protein
VVDWKDYQQGFFRDVLDGECFNLGVLANSCRNVEYGVRRAGHAVGGTALVTAARTTTFSMFRITGYEAATDLRHNWENQKYRDCHTTPCFYSSAHSHAPALILVVVKDHLVRVLVNRRAE